MLALEQKTYEHFAEVWSKEKTGREVHFICRKPTKQTLKIYQGLYKAAIALEILMGTEKIGLNEFLHPRKVSRFESLECFLGRGVQSAKHLLVECWTYTTRKNRR